MYVSNYPLQAAVSMGFSRSMVTNSVPSQVLDNTGGFQLTSPTLHPFHIRCKGNSDSEPRKKLSFSRRDAILSLTALSSAVFGISSPNIAEARPRNAEMRRKIREKLELLREKAGVSKQQESDKGQLPSTPPLQNKENNFQLEPPPLPLPELPLRLDTSTVEANYDL
ncbi:hypothetical protein vseg_004761 [Gypsophila vaccaria]